MDCVVEFVGVNAVDFCDVKVAIGREQVEDPIEEFETGKAEFWWEKDLEEALGKGQNP